MEDGFDSEGPDITSKRAEASVRLEQILAKLREADPRLLNIVYLKAAGYHPQEIADRLGISRRTYYRLDETVRSLATEM